MSRSILVRIILLLVLAGLASCESRKQPATFYPIDSLVRGQIHHLTTIGATLAKEALLRGKLDTATYIPADTMAWTRELEPFSKLSEINKPVNRGQYVVSEAMDRRSNLTVKAFQSKEELPIVYLKIYYRADINKPRKIEALYDQQNWLYKSARQLSMYFQQVGDANVLTSYSVKGGQKMILGDSVAFYISGKILVD